MIETKKIVNFVPFIRRKSIKLLLFVFFYEFYKLLSQHKLLFPLAFYFYFISILLYKELYFYMYVCIMYTENSISKQMKKGTLEYLILLILDKKQLYVSEIIDVLSKYKLLVVE